MDAFKSLYAPRAAHWYARDGKPCYAVDKVDGKGTKPTTVTDARKLKLLPSVTNILQCWPRPDLEIYKRKQDLLAAMTAVREPGESDESFCERVIADAAEHSNAAKAFGTHVHTLFELALLGHYPLPDDLMGPAFAWWPHIESWIAKNVSKCHWTEKVLVHDRLGYGCRADCLIELIGCEGQPVLCDFKSQGIRKSVKYYNEWVLQLTANAKALNPDFIDTTSMMPLASIVIDSTKPSEPILFLWSEDEKAKAWADFRACYELWKRVKQYDPGA